MSSNQSSPLDDGGEMNIMVIMQTKPAEITREMALAIIEYLVQSLGATDGISLHLSPDQLAKGETMLKKLKKFIKKQGSEFDEMRGKIRRFVVL